MSIQPMAGIVPDFDLEHRLARARQITGMSATEFGEQIGLSRNSISRYENGDRTPRRPILIAWALSSGVDLRWLETGEAPPSDGDDGASGSELPRLDSNQQPLDYQSAVVPLFARPGSLDRQAA